MDLVSWLYKKILKTLEEGGEELQSKTCSPVIDITCLNSSSQLVSAFYLIVFLTGYEHKLQWH